LPWIPSKKSTLVLQDLVTIENYSNKFRHVSRADIPRPGTTKYDINSLRYETAILWNTLLNEVSNLSLFDQIKN
jgi:hypothetical protein